MGWIQIKESPRIDEENIRAGRDVISIIGLRDWIVLRSIVLIVALGSIVLIVAILTLKDWTRPAAKVVAEVPASEAGRVEIPLGGVELTLDPQPVAVEWSPYSVDIRILGTTLYADGQLEVRGEVQLTKRSDLSSLHVEVTFDGETKAGFIDANTRTWKVFFEPNYSLAPGERLNFEAVLVSG